MLQSKKKGNAMSTLEIKDLHVEIEGKEILKGVNLTLKTGEIAANWITTLNISIKAGSWFLNCTKSCSRIK